MFGSRSIGIAPAVHDLQQLDRELHVADPAATALHLGELLAAPADVLLQADLGAPDVVDRADAELLRVDERRHALDERRPDPRVPGDGPGLDHRLAFPRGRLVLVVVERRLQAPRQDAAAAAGAEGRVDPERDPLGRRLRQRADQRRRGAFRLVLRLGAAVRVHEDEVDVARVVELAAARACRARSPPSGDRRRPAGTRPPGTPRRPARSPRRRPPTTRRPGRERRRAASRDDGTRGDRRRRRGARCRPPARRRAPAGSAGRRRRASRPPPDDGPGSPPRRSRTPTAGPRPAAPPDG